MLPRKMSKFEKRVLRGIKIGGGKRLSELIYFCIEKMGDFLEKARRTL